MRGVTLIEMLVVITLIALAVGVVVPSVTAGLDNLRLRTTAERLGNTFRYARETALRRQTVCQVRIDPAAATVEWQDLGLRASAGRRWDIPVGIQIRSERPRTFLFGPDGAAPRIDLVLANTRGRSATVEFDPLTAQPRVLTQ